MGTVISTKLTKGGQTTIPQSIRKALGIGAEDRVYWTCEGDRAYVTAKPEIPLSVTSARDFWHRIDQAEADIAGGRVVDAAALSDVLRSM
ncbi:MAG: hypothetical protein E7000_03030 [Coriobacteriaceae bacterium]|nr:hypothetical protein [Coriobacteriaceae bacterium]